MEESMWSKQFREAKQLEDDWEVSYCECGNTLTEYESENGFCKECL